MTYFFCIVYILLHLLDNDYFFLLNFIILEWHVMYEWFLSSMNIMWIKIETTWYTILTTIIIIAKNLMDGNAEKKVLDDYSSLISNWFIVIHCCLCCLWWQNGTWTFLFSLPCQINHIKETRLVSRTLISLIYNTFSSFIIVVAVVLTVRLYKKHYGRCCYKDYQSGMPAMIKFYTHRKTSNLSLNHLKYLN